MSLEIAFKKLHPDAVMPTRGSERAAGYDLTAVSMEYDENHNVVTFYTGIAVEIPSGFFGLLAPRSSVYRTGLIHADSIGIIDPDYRGELIFHYYVQRAWEQTYRPGDRVGQIVFPRFETVLFVERDRLSNTQRGTGGFGSTGR